MRKRGTNSLLRSPQKRSASMPRPLRSPPPGMPSSLGARGNTPVRPGPLIVTLPGATYNSGLRADPADPSGVLANSLSLATACLLFLTTTMSKPSRRVSDNREPRMGATGGWSASARRRALASKLFVAPQNTAAVHSTANRYRGYLESQHIESLRAQRSNLTRRGMARRSHGHLGDCFVAPGSSQ